MTSQYNSGITEIQSNHSVDETVASIKALLDAKGVKIFALIDHSGEAAAAGLSMPPTKLLIFGSPKAGTPIMVATPSAAIDLPLKILVRQDVDGRVWTCYNSPNYIQQRHGFATELIANIAIIELLATKASE